MANELVSTAKAAEALNVARSTLSRWASDGLVQPAQRTVGGHLRWDVADLRRQVDDLTRREHGKP
ncbi:helix-turn-helix domain-containing protein [Actinomycetospora soli]|uniref:helix-turn-helix domain-containing protein n=1 Tax=Actinomycetospora soli TaxID=2893887 RepID=UPI001E62CD3C|nr:helix-turn-helix domain-containing protein [Actinomycetospora soli]MCD2190968.1 helix-turn-helix domain-containing protein [Actinomycetospora soli]